jgi:hypothetical protein
VKDTPLIFKILVLEMLKYDEEEAYVKIPIAVPTSFLFFLG